MYEEQISVKIEKCQTCLGFGTFEVPGHKRTHKCPTCKGAGEFKRTV